jgi:hypothetical protein
MKTTPIRYINHSGVQIPIFKAQSNKTIFDSVIVRGIVPAGFLAAVLSLTWGIF